MTEISDISLREGVYRAIRHAILIGELAPGARLMEQQLSDDLGVSRTPIRDAIKALEEEKLVESIPRRGSYVADISEEGLMDVLEIRRALEGLSVSRCVRRIDSDEKAELKKSNEKMKRVMANAKRTTEEVAAADVEFHNIILEATRNERLVSMMGSLADQMYRYRYEFIKDRSNHELMLKEHLKIAECIFSGDEDGAVEAMQCHIDRQSEVILAVVKAKKDKN